MKRKHVLPILFILTTVLVISLGSCDLQSKDEDPVYGEVTPAVIEDFETSTAPIDEFMETVMFAIFMGDPSSVEGLTVNEEDGSFSYTNTGISVSGSMTESDSGGSINMTMTLTNLTDGVISISGTIQFSFISTSSETSETSEMTSTGTITITGGDVSQISVNMTVLTTETYDPYSETEVVTGTITIDGTTYLASEIMAEEEEEEIL